ncbi:hypothetical protein SPRG_01707 [Saprolegnia parasitica CBS 223.65]|uniref:Uncharacterized protein n=1 Tax=Saprolegnia parasitica (strain CBS 223.65) TaxID=695850 RepID=A0A067CTK0_SAPPC|nr:hypothetical protein SPRG_01707 [Saprolegnia parasitica CBS 223.65]KDO33828.1 hypothetical protein SPRG_01707 [Saprolegnia parasitica CBS 223.65]|eukprot:XP_012195464.1 hypothetical protein SPRG_01707 [Saprolegnia parasitica CBS 223.65]
MAEVKVNKAVDATDAAFYMAKAFISACETELIESTLGDMNLAAWTKDVAMVATTAPRQASSAPTAACGTTAYLHAKLEATTATLDEVQRRLEALGASGPQTLDECKADVLTLADDLAAMRRATARHAIDAIDDVMDAKPTHLAHVATATSTASSARLQHGSVEPSLKRKREDSEAPLPSPLKVPATPSMALIENDDPLLQPLITELKKLRATAPWAAHDRTPYLMSQPDDSPDAQRALEQHNVRVQAFHDECGALLWERSFLWPSRDAASSFKVLQKRVMALVVDLVVLVHTGVVDARIYACLLYPHPSWPSIPLPVDLKQLAKTSSVNRAMQYLRQQHCCLWPLPPRRATATTLGSAFQTTLDVLQAGISVRKWMELTDNRVSRDDVKAACLSALQSASSMQTIMTHVPRFARSREVPPPAWILGAPTYLHGE